ncbi:MAG TPA: GNAT family N-acetyltransferase [Nitrososphaerales archaeon]|nr:GNAT family N-acetyltransferase [Nitrososphaerales archaeon]
MTQSNPVLQNEFSFDRLFCEVLEGSNYSLYYNSHFSDDPIFNHAAISNYILDSDEYSSIEIASIIDAIIISTENVKVPASIYVERFWKNARKIEGDAIDSGFRIIEQMEVMTKKVEPPAEECGDIKVDQTRDVDAWNKAFVKSFAIPPGWLPELERRVRISLDDRSTILIMAKEKNLIEPSGCLLMHIDPQDHLGVYCVGTIPERRSHGVAKAMMAKAQGYAFENSCKRILLQTLKSDGVTPMYLNMGFDIAFERDVLQLQPE